jgi:hypothetical protein
MFPLGGRARLHSSTARSSCSCGTRPPAFFFFSARAGQLGVVQPDAGDSRRFLEQIISGASSVACHYGTRSEGEAQRVRLVVEIQNDLSRHKYFSLSLTERVEAEPTQLERTN